MKMKMIEIMPYHWVPEKDIVSLVRRGTDVCVSVKRIQGEIPLGAEWGETPEQKVENFLRQLEKS